MSFHKIPWRPELGQKVETPEGTVVITDHQTAGRGQRGNTWEAQPGKNLTFSLILKPDFLAAKDQFQLNEAISVGIARISLHSLHIKLR